MIYCLCGVFGADRDVTGVVGEADGVHHIYIESQQLQRKCRGLVTAVSRDDVGLDAEDSWTGHDGVQWRGLQERKKGNEMNGTRDRFFFFGPIGFDTLNGEGNRKIANVADSKQQHPTPRQER